MKQLRSTLEVLGGQQTSLWRSAFYSLFTVIMDMRWRITQLICFAISLELVASLVEKLFPVTIDTFFLMIPVAVYLVVSVVDEIGFQKLLAKIDQQRFHKIAQSLGDGVICTDEKGCITFWNPGAEQIFQYSADEIIGRSIELLYVNVNITKYGNPFYLKNLVEKETDAPNGQILELVGVRKNGETFDLEACFSSWHCDDGFHYGATMRDISERKQIEQKIRYQAKHDSLTDLANRNSFNEALSGCIERSSCNSSQVAILIIDLDDFKQINDTFGHQCGDAVLREVAGSFRKWAPDDLIFRMGGDEFSILVEGKEAAKRAAKIAADITNLLSATPFIIEGSKLRADASIGIAVFPFDGEDAVALLSNADLALYRAKEKDAAGYVFYHTELRQKLDARRILEKELEQAFAKNEFELFYQPQVDLKNGGIVGVEALIRWHHPERGLVSPMEFMPCIHDCGLSVPVAYWVLETAATQASVWEQQGHSIRMAVNLSQSQFFCDELPQKVQSILEKTNLSPSLLELEVTEDILIEDDELAVGILKAIHRLGVSIAFDDFGTGYASLTYLKRFPLDRLKIDRSFVSNMTNFSDDDAIVRTIIGLGKLMGLSIIAEGIEDQETIEILQELECAEGQGYYFGRPMPATDLQTLLEPADGWTNLIGNKSVKVITAA